MIFSTKDLIIETQDISVKRGFHSLFPLLLSFSKVIVQKKWPKSSLLSLRRPIYISDKRQNRVRETEIAFAIWLRKNFLLICSEIAFAKWVSRSRFQPFLKSFQSVLISRTRNQLRVSEMLVPCHVHLVHLLPPLCFSCTF